MPDKKSLYWSLGIYCTSASVWWLSSHFTYYKGTSALHVLCLYIATKTTCQPYLLEGLRLATCSRMIHQLCDACLKQDDRSALLCMFDCLPEGPKPFLAESCFSIRTHSLSTSPFYRCEKGGKDSQAC